MNPCIFSIGSWHPHMHCTKGNSMQPAVPKVKRCMISSWHAHMRTEATNKTLGKLLASCMRFHTALKAIQCKQQTQKHIYGMRRDSKQSKGMLRGMHCACFNACLSAFCAHMSCVLVVCCRPWLRQLGKMASSSDCIQVLFESSS